MQIVSNRDTLDEMSTPPPLYLGVGRGWGIFDPLTFTTFWANSADDKLVLFIFYKENRILHFMQIVFFGDNLHEMSNPVFLKT